jgi:hypothetical protein
MIFISPKVIEQFNFKNKLKVLSFTNLPLDKWGYLWFTLKICLVVMFLEVNSYDNNKGVGMVYNFLPPIICYVFGFICMI